MPVMVSGLSGVIDSFVRVHNGYRGQTGYLQDGIHYSAFPTLWYASKKKTTIHSYSYSEAIDTVNNLAKQREQ